MSFKSLYNYQKASELAMEVFKLPFSVEERFVFFNAIVRSSRSVCAAIAEVYRKREYPVYLINKLTDADSENAGTQRWLDAAEACEYISVKPKLILQSQSEEVGN